VTLAARKLLSGVSLRGHGPSLLRIRPRLGPKSSERYAAAAWREVTLNVRVARGRGGPVAAIASG
jgi:hypothetical protein